MINEIFQPKVKLRILHFSHKNQPPNLDYRLLCMRQDVSAPRPRAPPEVRTSPHPFRKPMPTVGVEHGFTRMVRIGTDKKSVGIRRIRVIRVQLRGFYIFSYQSKEVCIFPLCPGMKKSTTNSYELIRTHAAGVRTSSY